jgi:hypothetical protein
MFQLDLFRSTLTIDPLIPPETATAIINHISSDNRGILVHSVMHPSTVKQMFPNYSDRKTWIEATTLDINVNTKRMKLFDVQPACSCCGREVTVYVIEQQTSREDDLPYLNAYSVSASGIHEMTVDHMLPRAAGGNNAQHNCVTMCQPCNNGKTVLMSLAEIATVSVNIDRYKKHWVHPEFVKTMLRLQKYTHGLSGTQRSTAIGIIKECASGLNQGFKPVTYQKRIDRMNVFMNVSKPRTPSPKPLQVQPNWIQRKWKYLVWTIKTTLLTFFLK